MSIVARLMGRHARQPRGWVGRLVVRLMTRTTRPCFTWTADLLELGPELDLLDVGFGNGESLEVFSDRLDRGKVVGVELSQTMIELAEQNLAARIAEGRIELRPTTGGPLPVGDGQFDRVATLNTIYITERPPELFRELLRALRPGGVAAVTFPQRHAMAKLPMASTEGFFLHELATLEQGLRDAGFVDVQVHARPDLPTPYHCLTGRRPTA